MQMYMYKHFFFQNSNNNDWEIMQMYIYKKMLVKEQE